MLNARRYTERIELFTNAETADDYGRRDVTFVSKGTFPAEVNEATGSRLVWYQQQGRSNPINIEMRICGFIPTKLIWRGREVIVRSYSEDRRSRRAFIDGDAREIVPTTTAYPTTTIAASTTIAQTTVL